MTLLYVADIGNSRIKIGRCGPDRVESAESLPPEHAFAFEAPKGASWLIAGVQPDWRERFAVHQRERGCVVRVVTDYRELPIRVDVDAPTKVGLDRLLNAVAAHPYRPSAVVSVGTAVTVDLVDGTGTFRGGAIFPGFRLMARALNMHTAQLPLVDGFDRQSLPGRDTQSAIAGGIGAAVVGGIERAVAQFTVTATNLKVILTGGDADLVGPLHCSPIRVGPYLVLEGLRLTAHDRP